MLTKVAVELDGLFLGCFMQLRVEKISFEDYWSEDSD